MFLTYELLSSIYVSTVTMEPSPRILNSHLFKSHEVKIRIELREEYSKPANLTFPKVYSSCEISLIHSPSHHHSLSSSSTNFLHHSITQHSFNNSTTLYNPTLFHQQIHQNAILYHRRHFRHPGRNCLCSGNPSNPRSCDLAPKK